MNDKVEESYGATAVSICIEATPTEAANNLAGDTVTEDENLVSRKLHMPGTQKEI